MSVKNIVKVMNFHALLRVSSAREKVNQATRYEDELKEVISVVINNRIFNQDRVTLNLKPGAKELNIYIGSDMGFCANFNADVMNYLRTDDSKNDKIVIGKRVRLKVDNEIFYTDKESLDENIDQIFQIILDGALNRVYSKINLIYVHFYSVTKQEVTKRTILPFDYGLEKNVIKRKLNYTEDFVCEGNVYTVIWNLIAIYVSMEIEIATAWSYASENVERQSFTNESLKKIDEKAELDAKAARKAKHAKAFKAIVEMNNKKKRDKTLK